MTKPWPYPRWIAHRGAGKRAPENTLAAFRLGHQYGWRAFECDVKLSGDGQLFLMHDATLERTTSGRGPADALDWAALSKLDAGGWHSAPYAGEPLPTLDAIARFCLANDCSLNIEIKPVPGTDARTGAAVAHAAAALWRGATPPLLSSFEIPALEAARDAVPELPRALLLKHKPADWLALAQGLGACAVVFDHKLMDAAAIEALHAAGLRALVYTVNDPARADELFSWGLDGLISDAVDVFKP